MTTKPQPRLAASLGAYHDEFARMLDRMERKLFPRLDMTNTADAQIRDLCRDLANCMAMRRQELDGYPLPDDPP